MCEKWYNGKILSSLYFLKNISTLKLGKGLIQVTCEHSIMIMPSGLK